MLTNLLRSFPFVISSFPPIFFFSKKHSNRFRNIGLSAMTALILLSKQRKKKRRKCCESYMKAVSFTLLCRFIFTLLFFGESRAWKHFLSTHIILSTATVRSFQFARTFHLFMNASDRKKVINVKLSENPYWTEREWYIKASFISINNFNAIKWHVLSISLNFTVSFPVFFF